MSDVLGSVHHWTHLAQLAPRQGGPDAVVFDMDGVLADTEPVQQAALGVFLSRRGRHLPSEEYGRLVGLANDRAWAWIADRVDLPHDTAAYRTECEAILLPLIAERLRPDPAAVELVHRLRDRGYPLGLASSSYRAVVDAVLAVIGLSAAFRATVSGDEVTTGKPDPEIYRLAAARLAVDPRKCAAIEDSPHGMQAARAAGMWVVGLTTRYTRGLLLPADLVVESLGELLVNMPAGERR